MLPRWQALADTQPARVKQLLQSLMLGGDPLAIPGLPMLKLESAYTRRSACATVRRMAGQSARSYAHAG